MVAALVFTMAAGKSDGQVVISEFMAANDETLADGDGNYSDWIELYNLGDSSVDLTGWYLSDDANELTQWQFPSKSIGAGEFLVVFASGQDTTDYVDSLGYLHTTFKLSAGGEDVILTQDDGVTVAYSFLDYPEQDDDVSYGLNQDSDTTCLIAEGEDATAYVGTSSAPGSTWNSSTSFTFSGGTSGTTGVGYDKESTYSSADIGLDLESKMIVTTTSTRPPFVSTSTYYNSAYIRMVFSVDDASSIEQLALRMKYDDGFVAYINGTQVASANAPTSPTYNSSATAAHDGTSYEDFTILNAGDLLVSGDNVLAIQGLAYLTTSTLGPPGSSSSSSTDFFIMPVLNSVAAGPIYTNTAVYLTTPTPGGDNVQGILGYVDDTKFSVDRGFFTAATNVQITCDTEGAEIYYTTDATTPSADNGTRYTGPITISKTTVLRAVATKSGWQASDVDTQSYFFLSDIIAQGTGVSSLDPDFPASSVNGQSFDYGMDTDITQSATYSGQIEGALTAIPSISIVTDPDNLFDSSIGIYVNASEENDEENGADWERETSIELINPDGADGFQINGGIRIRGASSSSSSNPKHSFRFFFRSEYGTSRLNYPLFGEDGADSFKRMDLRTGQNFSWAFMTPQYATWLYDIFTRDTHRDMGKPYTRGEYYHLYINGMYWGLYQTEERCNADFAESYYGDDDDDFDAVKSDADTGDMYAVDGTRDAYDSLWSAASSGFSSDSAYFAVQGKNADGTDNGSYTKLLDVDNVIDYMLMIYFTGNRDSPIGPPNSASMPRNLNAIYNRATPDGFKFVAHDNEHSLEVSMGVSHNRFSQTLGTAFNYADYFTPWWLNLKLMNNEEYALTFADHVHEHFFNGGALTATATANRVEVRKGEIYAAVVAESARWGDSASTSPRTRDDDWLTWADWLTDTYMAQRTDIVFAQIVAKGWYPSIDAPEFSRHGGSIDSGFSLSISGSGTIYYTTDGSDPRAVGGAVAGTTYGSAITLTRSALVKARCLSSSGEWSALTKATFVLNEESPLRVTEIMYHPDDTGAEFIELLNTGSETVGLAGTEFTEGIRFDFTDGDTATLAPGEYAILVGDYDAFTNRYSNWASINIAGKYHGKFFIPNGSLDNGGEEIVLKDGLGKTILDFEYEDWYAATDGEGFSLTLIDPTAATNTWSDSSSWRASKYSGGTPGEGPEAFLNTGDLLINEALTHQDDDTPGDWIELFNASTNTLDINGWYLSDDEDERGKVELSGLSTIAPGGYLVLTEASHFGYSSARTNGFALSELGESIYLSSGEDGALTGYRVEESFGAAERDVTFGRHVKSDGEVDFTAQSAQTSGATNAYPLIGDVVVSEIMYHPADSNAFEFIELFNRTSSAVALYDATYPTNTWKLDGAVEYTFPEGTVLAAGQCLIVSETDAATFRAYYSVDESVTVLGPYDGKLNNDGEELELTRPGDPEALTGEIPYILVERIEFNDAAPWPTAADGLGASLERIDAALYPNDAANWTANASPSPGSTALDAGAVDADGDDMPDSWETAYFGSTAAENGGADDDWDEDGASNYAEYVAGTDPTDAESVFEIKSLAVGDACVFTWSSATGKTYSLWFSTNLVSGGFAPCETSIPSTPPLNTFTAGVDDVECIYYRVYISGE
ncbi:lamin tail domain-containing protein [Pontiella sp.]|uniref:lamin tail domain-containing protein n=1 Tax=Pontiella sp. TaxID=2837462 RepID=UPI003563C737